MERRNVVDLRHSPIEAVNPAPLPVLLYVKSAPSTANYVGGVPSNTSRIEKYVLVDALPEELKFRVELAIDAIRSGM